MNYFIQKIFGTEKPKANNPEIIITMSNGTDYYLKVVEIALIDQSNEYELGKHEKRILKIAGNLIKPTIKHTRKNTEKSIGNMHFIRPSNVKPLITKLKTKGYEVSFN